MYLQKSGVFEEKRNQLKSSNVSSESSEDPNKNQSTLNINQCYFGHPDETENRNSATDASCYGFFERSKALPTADQIQHHENQTFSQVPDAVHTQAQLLWQAPRRRAAQHVPAALTRVMSPTMINHENMEELSRFFPERRNAGVYDRPHVDECIGDMNSDETEYLDQQHHNPSISDESMLQALYARKLEKVLK
jgi:hypothetical protein